ncbi:MAG: DUF2442 domain-containing protein [Chloroflexi bacterium]|nr:DUF2442 domain-containing protein [Chloroflexota bacterium]
MSTKLEQVNDKFQVKRYKIQYPISAYTFPRETRLQLVRFDDKYIHIELTDGRVLSVPLGWIPTVHHAAPEEREKYEISRDRTMIIWDPAKCAINDEIRISDYLEPLNNISKMVAEKKTEYRVKPATRQRRVTRHKPRARAK